MKKQNDGKSASLSLGKADRRKIGRQYTESNTALEAVRAESRSARSALIEAIMCDRRDVLCKSDITKIRRSLKVFLEVQRRLLTAFYGNSLCKARYMRSVSRATFK